MANLEDQKSSTSEEGPIAREMREWRENLQAAYKKAEADFPHSYVVELDTEEFTRGYEWLEQNAQEDQWQFIGHDGALGIFGTVYVN